MALVGRLLSGLLLWAAGFSLLYALHGYGCAAGWGAYGFGPTTWLGAVLIAAWLACLVAGAGLVAWLHARAGRERDPLLAGIALFGGWAGLGGLAFMGAPVLLPAHCL